MTKEEERRVDSIVDAIKSVAAATNRVADGVDDHLRLIVARESYVADPSLEAVLAAIRTRLK